MEGHSYRNFIHQRCHQNVSRQSCSYCQMLKCGWYWGRISRKEVSELLAKEDDKVFLVRDSSDSRHILCLSFRCYGRTFHVLFEHANGLYSLDNKIFVPASQILEHCTTCIQSMQPSVPIKLARPINRFAKLDSLQMICRYVIRQTVSRNAWDKLPLPPSLISYVSKGSDYVVPANTKTL